jgi:hypothetical protein
VAALSSAKASPAVDLLGASHAPLCSGSTLDLKELGSYSIRFLRQTQFKTVDSAQAPNSRRQTVPNAIKDPATTTALSATTDARAGDIGCSDRPQRHTWAQLQRSRYGRDMGSARRFRSSVLATMGASLLAVAAVPVAIAGS